jgi:hypothetical protein
MADHIDDQFYRRADSFIDVANQYCPETERNQVSASLLYAAARFNAWVSATGFESEAEMRAARSATIEFFIAQYREMLEENIDDYISHFDDYMRPGR